MAEMKPPENVKTARIRTSVAKIIVEGRGGREYYSILYLDQSDGRLHIGFSSSNLGFVRKWLEEEFEVDESIGDDFANVVHCKGCKHSYEGHPYYCEDVVERFCMHGVYRHVTVTDDFFCGYGEKKDGDENGGVR